MLTVNRRRSEAAFSRRSRDGARLSSRLSYKPSLRTYFAANLFSSTHVFREARARSHARACLRRARDATRSRSESLCTLVAVGRGRLPAILVTGIHVEHLRRKDFRRKDRETHEKQQACWYAIG